MIILLDIDGVLVTTPPWKKSDFAPDGFMVFNTVAARNLASLIAETNAYVILISTHRINYTIPQWHEIFRLRGITVSSISMLNEVKQVSQMMNRATEIQEWINNNGDENFVIIDDDKSINDLPEPIRNRCVLTDSFIGLNDDAKQKALDILFLTDPKSV